METSNKSYYAIIPASVRYDEDLMANAKLLYGEITALSNEKGFCWAGDKYFSDLYKVNKATIQKWLKSLEDNGYIDRQVKYVEGTQQIEHRYITIRVYPTLEKECTPTLEKARVNNTLINNTTNIPYAEIIDYLNQKTNKNFKIGAAHKKVITARWKEGFKTDDFKKVIDNMVKKWSGVVFNNGNPGNDYLKPSTLFGSKFDEYLNLSTSETSTKSVSKMRPEKIIVSENYKI